jgi:hypothetical protein
MESFQPGLSFIPISRAEISGWPQDKILLNTASDYMTKISARTEVPVRLKLPAENRHVIDGKFQLGLKYKQRLIKWLYFCLFDLFLNATTVLQKSNNRYEQHFKFFEEAE